MTRNVGIKCPTLFKKTILLSLILILFCFNLYSNDSKTKLKTKVEIIQLAPRTLNNYTTYVGTLQPVTKVDLSSEIAGIIEMLKVDTGTPVKTGEIVVQIDTRRQKLNKRLNESNYNLALEDYNREKALLTKNLSTPAKVSNLKNKLEVNRLSLELAKLDLMKSRVKAPISGVVSSKFIEAGEYVRVGDKLLEILDISRVLGVVNIPEREIHYIHYGKEVKITIDALPDEIFKGYVKTIGLEADSKSRSFEIEVLINNAQKKLLPGMLVRAQLLKMSLPRQIIIPRHTIQEGEEGSFVYTLNNETAIKKFINLGISINDEVQVTSGLKFGDLLIETGQQLVSPNEQVDVISMKKQ